MVPQDVRREEQYSVAKRSLRVWPVAGPDMKASMKKFLEDKLKLGRGFVDVAGDIIIEKYMDSRSKNANEVILIFRNKGIRDLVRAAAKNLAGEGRAAGIRMQVPGFLTMNFKLLENLGYQMKRVNPDTRRVIKLSLIHI